MRSIGHNNLRSCVIACFAASLILSSAGANAQVVSITAANRNYYSIQKASRHGDAPSIAEKCNNRLA